MRALGLLLGFLFFFKTSNGQFLMDMVDTSKEVGSGILSMYKNFNHLRIGGYIQTQFQLSSSPGISSFSGGDFPQGVDNRFMIRRGRIRFDYLHFNSNKGPSVQFVFQFDGTERGVFIRDFWGRMFENRWKAFSVTSGMFARPFGYEINLSSSERESPERGRMSQLLMKTERDLGVMLSFEPRKADHPLRKIKFDLGLFNGQGLAATTDFDSKKDIISRIGIKSFKVSKTAVLNGGISVLHGGFIQSTKYVYSIEKINGGKQFIVDSSAGNAGSYAPRSYFGADLQFKVSTGAGYSELRLEGIEGKQTATQGSSETPARLLAGKEGYYRRNFRGAYLYLLNNIFNTHHQIGLKFDFYDPNTGVSGKEINSDFTSADVCFSTLGIGYNFYMNSNLKCMLWYDKVWNEKTNLAGYTEDVSDNVLTIRLQYRF